MVDYAVITLSQPRDGHASEDDDEDGGGKRSSGGGSKGRAEAGRGGEPTSGGGGGGGGGSASSSSGKKPRGRPPGSKNKPKPPVVITRESESAMHPLVLELSAGCDILESISSFARRRRVGVSVLSGSGAVANVALRHPTSPAATITLHGRFDILSLTGTFLPPPPLPVSSSAAASVVPQSCATKATFTISLAGSQGQVIGGTVVGTLTAAGPVVLVAASFANPEFHRLPEAEDEEARDEEAKPMAVAEPAPVYSVAVSNPMAGSQLTHEMVLWATPSSSRAPTHHAHPSSHY